MTAVSVLGLGPMGRALTGALLDAGLPVTVWNRTEARADGARARGATWARTPADAVAASEVILINVVDHGVVDELLAAAGPSLAGRTVVSLTSDTPETARRTAKLVSDAGARYLDGAIMTPTTTIGTAADSILFAGPREVFEKQLEVLTVLATPTWVGGDHARAAAFDVALLNLFWTSVSGVLNSLKVADANGISAEEFLPHALGIADILPPIITELAERVRDDRHDGSESPVVSVSTSLRHLIAASRNAGVDAAALESLRASADAAVAAGHGQEEISRVFAYLARNT